MKFLIVSNVLCNIDYLLQQIRNVNIDAVLSVGNFGVMKGFKKDTYIYHESPKLTGYKKDILRMNGGKFQNILKQRIILPHKTIIVNNFGDNGYLVSKIRDKKIKISNMQIPYPGELVKYGGVNIVSFGGKYNKPISNKKKIANNYFDMHDISIPYLYETNKIHVLLLNDVFGGKEKDGSFDLTKTVRLDNGFDTDLMSFIEKFDIDLICLGDCESKNGYPRDDLITWNYGRGERIFLACQDMTTHCYIYNTETKQITYV